MINEQENKELLNQHKFFIIEEYEGRLGLLVLESHKKILARLNERDELQVIVDKLPKTADEVPITPSMYVWVIDRPKIPEVKYRSLLVGRVGLECIEDDDGFFAEHPEDLFYRHPETNKTVKESENEK